MASGMIPTELDLLRELKNLFLQENRLQRKIPTKLLSKMKSEELCLESNQLTGPIPDDVGLLQETIVFLASLTIPSPMREKLCRTHTPGTTRLLTTSIEPHTEELYVDTTSTK
jgi:hypothetical protein